MDKRILLLLAVFSILLCGNASAQSCTDLFNLQEIAFTPQSAAGDINMWAGTTLVNDCGGTANVTFRWYANQTLIRSTLFTGQINNSAMNDLLDDTLYLRADAVSLEITAEHENASFQQNGTVTDCTDGFDNDGDGEIDFNQLESDIATDTNCVATYDDTEDVTEGISCTVTGGGSVIFQQEFTETGDEVFVGPDGEEQTRNDLLDALKELNTDEIPCNDIDDNGNGLIDETCPLKNISIRADTGARSFVLYVPPGEVRDDRFVSITNLGEETTDVVLSCEGARACAYITFEKEEVRVIASPDLPEEVGFTIDVPLTETKGNEYPLRLIATDPKTGQRSNVLLELRIDNRLAALKVLDDFFGRPICRNVGIAGKTPICTNYYELSLFGFSVALVLTIIGVLIARRIGNRRRIQGIRRR